MVDSMSKKEKLARGSAVIKVMKVIPRPGHFLKTYVDPRKLPKTPNPFAAKGILAEMPWLDVKNAYFSISPGSAKVKASPLPGLDPDKEDICSPNLGGESLGLPDGDKLYDWYRYRTWINEINTISDGNIAEHFDIMLGLLITMAQDPENGNFPDVEAYPCIQFLRAIKTEEGNVPYNTAAFVSYIEFVCQKMVDEG